jgi:hypothetical protein
MCPWIHPCVSVSAGDRNGGPQDSGGLFGSGLLQNRQLFGLLSRSQQKAKTNHDSSQSRGAAYFHEQDPIEDNQEYIYLSGDDTGDSAQLPKSSMPPVLLYSPRADTTPASSVGTPGPVRTLWVTMFKVMGASKAILTKMTGSAKDP